MPRPVIGAVIAAYAAGRRDARAGRRRKRRRDAHGNLAENKRLRAFYVLGLNDERHRMHVDRRLVQVELPFMHEDPHAHGPEAVSGGLAGDLPRDPEA